MDGQIWAYRVYQLLDTIRLGSPNTPTGIAGCEQIHALKLMYDLSSNTIALRNFLPIVPSHGAFSQEFTVVNLTNLSLALALLEVIMTIRLYLSCNLHHRYQ